MCGVALDDQVDLDLQALGKKPFDRREDHKDGEDGKGGGTITTTRMESTKNNIIVNVHVEPANINDVTPIPEILKEIKGRLEYLPKYMGLGKVGISKGFQPCLHEKAQRQAHL